MDSSSKRTPPLHVAAVVSFYMFAALVVRPLVPSLLPALIHSRWSLCRFLLKHACLASLDVNPLAPLKEQDRAQLYPRYPTSLPISPAANRSRLPPYLSSIFF